jgi:hypothetical protein
MSHDEKGCTRYFGCNGGLADAGGCRKRGTPAGGKSAACPVGYSSLFLEYEDVLKRPEQRIAHGLTLEMVDEFLVELAALVEPAEVRFLWRP